MTFIRRLTAALALGCALPVLVAADTLVLRNGQRINGELVSVRGSVVEFDEERSGGRRTIRLDRNDIARIELDGAGGGSGGGWGGGGGWSGGGRPPGMRQRTVSASATAPWSDTGIDVRGGQTLYFEASGQVRWGPDRRDGPEGEDDSPFNATRPIPNRPGAGLIGRVGQGSRDAFFIGAERGPIRMRESGRLYLGINDDHLADNSGSFRVTVYY
jgi:hypothetical protein